MISSAKNGLPSAWRTRRRSSSRGKVPARDAANDVDRLLVRERSQRELRERALHAPGRLMIETMADQDHEAGAVRPADGARQHLAGSLVHPLHVLDDHHDRRVACWRDRHQTRDRGEGLALEIVVARLVGAAIAAGAEPEDVGQRRVRRRDLRRRAPRACRRSSPTPPPRRRRRRDRNTCAPSPPKARTAPTASSPSSAPRRRRRARRRAAASARE